MFRFRQLTALLLTDDYGFGSHQHKWTDSFSDPVVNREFIAARDETVKTCQDFYTSYEEFPFPPRDDGMNAFESIQYWISKAEEYGQLFNGFPTLTAPWPILLQLIADVPQEECEWIWKRWLKNEDMIMYGIYHKQIFEEETICRASDWSRGSIPRIKEDGGICGQLATQAKYTHICLGNPANLRSQPSHIALFAIHYNPQKTDPLEGPYLFESYQGVGDELDTTSGSSGQLDKHCLTQAGQSVRRRVTMDFERGILITVNQGYDVFQNARIAHNIFHRLDDRDKAQYLPRLVDVMEVSVHYAHAWSSIADYLTGEIFTYTRETVRYPTLCRDVPGLETIRSRLKELADTHFYDQQVHYHVMS